MTILDPPLERRLRGIEVRLTGLGADLDDIKTDLAVIKKQLEQLPSRWMQIVFALGILIPIYGILAALLIQVSK